MSTTRFEKPTSFNTTPLNSIGSGRGSIVFFNNASSFHWMLTGKQFMTDAIKEWGGEEELSRFIAAKAATVISSSKMIQ